MIIGVPKEIKTREYRVGMTPAGVRSLTARGHKVLVEKGAGEGSGHHGRATTSPPAAPSSPTAADAWGAEMVVKVKEPLPAEYGFFRENLILYTYLHLAPEPELTKQLAREEGHRRRLRDDRERRRHAPAPSPDERGRGPHGRAGRRERASRRSTAARACSSAACPARVAVASSSSAAASSAATRRPSPSAWARRSPCSTCAPRRWRYLEDVFGGAVETLYSNPYNIEQAVLRADLVVGAVLVTGAAAPKLVTRGAHRARWRRAASSSTSPSTRAAASRRAARRRTTTRPTRSTASSTTASPNMPGAVAQTSTWALTNTTMAYALKIADMGLVAAAQGRPRAALKGVNTYGGHVTCEPRRAGAQDGVRARSRSCSAKLLFPRLGGLYRCATLSAQ